jgi:cytochrome c-type biogenesis protein CcmE
MKKSHIIALVIIAIAMALIFSTFDSASTYVNFTQAKELSKASSDEVHVVGELSKDAQGNILGMIYEPSIDPNRFMFQLIDDEGVEETVYLYQPKPTDIEKSEKVVVSGRYVQDKFVAKKVLLKCPSKYAEKEIKQYEK